jgi:hypothetical protein
MNYLVTESERNSIRKLHNTQRGYDSVIKESMGLLNTISESVVITDWLSPDDKYLILFDEMYDLHEGKRMGDVWENFDNFKLFISHSFEVATNVPKQVKEFIAESVKSLVLTESTQDFTKLKPYFKNLLRNGNLIKEEQGFLDWMGSGIASAGEWVWDKTKEFGKDVADVATTVGKGLYDAGDALVHGDWSRLGSIVGGWLTGGTLWLARKVRNMMYNPVGIVIDTFFVMSGIGKAFQWIPWAIIVALDLYEIISGDYEDKDMATWLRWLLYGADVLGLVFAGGVAGAAKAAFSVFKGARTAEEFAAIAARNPNTVKWIEKIAGALSKVPEYLGKAASYLKTTWIAKLSPWIENILTKAESVLQQGAKSMSEISGAAKAGKTTADASRVVTPLKQRMLTKGLPGAAKSLGVVTAVDRAIKKGVQLYKGQSDAEREAEEKNIKAGKSAQSAIDKAEKELGRNFVDELDK